MSFDIALICLCVLTDGDHYFLSCNLTLNQNDVLVNLVAFTITNLSVLLMEDLYYHMFKISISQDDLVFLSSQKDGCCTAPAAHAGPAM